MNKYNIVTKGIVKYQDKYLIVKKWYDDRIGEPYQWDFINGKLEYAESPDRGVIRAIEENTGLSAEVFRILYTWSYMLGDICNVGICYLCLCDDTTNVILSEELNDYAWVAEEEFESYIDNKSVIEDIKRSDLSEF